MDYFVGEKMLESFRSFLMNLAEKGDIPSSFKYGFVINAMICALLIGPILGGIGTMVVTKKNGFLFRSSWTCCYDRDSYWCTTWRTIFRHHIFHFLHIVYYLV